MLSILRRVLIPPKSRALVLIYHRVIDLDTDPQLLAVTPKHFDEHLEVLRREYSPVSVDQVVGSAKRASQERNKIAITIDDGYSDNAQKALPLLEKYGVPATCYIATGHVGNHEEFWWDDLERLLLQPGVLPPVLEILLQGKQFRWDLGEYAAYSTDDWRKDSKWNVLQGQDPTYRHSLYRVLHGLMMPLHEAERQEAIACLRKWAMAGDRARDSHLPMSEGDISRLSGTGIMEIGSHSVTHSVLSALPEEAQQWEIQQSKAALEEMTGHPVVSFSYPFGGRLDYTRQTVEIVRRSGFNNACSNFSGTVHRWTDPYQLPRFLVRDWDGDKFSRRLSEWSRVL